MGWAIFLGVVAGVCIVGAVVYHKISKKIRNVSREMFGTEDFVEGYKQVKNAVASTPKSVNSMTRLMEPQIARDFPEFSWPEFKHRAENMLLSALLALESQDTGRLQDCDDEVRNQVQNRIGDAILAGVTEHFDQAHIHQTEIADYRKVNGTCVITIQSSIEYYYFKTRGTIAAPSSEGELVSGSRDRKVQTKYNMELVYIQDASITYVDNAVGTTCPNCGAVVTALGHKFCEFCGTEITPINIKVWSLHNFKEVEH